MIILAVSTLRPPMSLTLQWQVDKEIGSKQQGEHAHRLVDPHDHLTIAQIILRKCNSRHPCLRFNQNADANM